jgi:hypothetical protein
MTGKGRSGVYTLVILLIWYKPSAGFYAWPETNSKKCAPTPLSYLTEVSGIFYLIFEGQNFEIFYIIYENVWFTMRRINDIKTISYRCIK